MFSCAIFSSSSFFVHELLTFICWQFPSASFVHPIIKVFSVVLLSPKKDSPDPDKTVSKSSQSKTDLCSSVFSASAYQTLKFEHEDQFWTLPSLVFFVNFWSKTTTLSRFLQSSIWRAPLFCTFCVSQNKDFDHSSSWSPILPTPYTLVWQKIPWQKSPKDF